MDIEAATQILQGTFGANKGALAPTSHTLHLFTDDPENGGVEITTGYTPPTLTNDGTQWATFTGGYLIGELVTVSFTTDLDPPARYWRLKGADGHWGPHGKLASEWLGGAGASRQVRPRMTVQMGGV